ncbi:glutamine amidotransferase [Thalassoglobus polymorphus]|uniref:Putative glutamine amidotransferase domain-containing protein n=1 Tax=Thalassoglobus polymorphus TaxID=2527994 RepID=A0A517QV49_9PLAN|nr:glutamine amidotransferase [Thalassoglobus polymorphus]QDT35484.1 hypothetical protein Mal48_47610 [Thalassoglobus polymorphus]
MPRQILFLGDTSLETAASYLAGCIDHSGWSFDYIPSDQSLELNQLTEPYQLYILSDYPAAHLNEEVENRLVQHVENGSNLLMIGGWESYHGMGGDWDGTKISQLLPVKILSNDDRQNCDSPVFLKAQAEHPITANLPWEDRSPIIGGYNKVTAKTDADVLLTAERFKSKLAGADYSLTHESSDPLLVVSETAKSRIAALMTDLAPHWVGPLVDWGDNRVAAQAPGSEGVEVGNLYAQFVSQLVKWVGKF